MTREEAREHYKHQLPVQIGARWNRGGEIGTIIELRGMFGQPIHEPAKGFTWCRVRFDEGNAYDFGYEQLRKVL